MGGMKTWTYFGTSGQLVNEARFCIYLRLAVVFIFSLSFDEVSTYNIALVSK